MQAVKDNTASYIGKTLELIPSRYDDDEVTDISRIRASIDHSITAYIRLDQEMLDLDDKRLVIRIPASIEARDGYHYYQYVTPGTQLKSASTFVYCCPQSSESQRQVPYDRCRHIHTWMEAFICSGSINGMVDRPNGYVRITNEHLTGHRTAPHAINDIKNYMFLIMVSLFFIFQKFK